MDKELDWLVFNDLESDPDMSLEPGWYPILICWDLAEGFFPGAAEWSGSEWKSGDPVSHYWPSKFDDASAAKEFAYKQDPLW